MRSVEIVTHCYAVEYPHFADALVYQLTSLMEQPCVEVTLCLASGGSDYLTSSVVDRLGDFCGLNVIKLPIERLGRRSIGRNIAARRTEADLVWFADVDYVFDVRCLDALRTMQWPEGASLIYPNQVWIHNDHATGDRALALARTQIYPKIDKREFKPKEYNRAIGGAQIVQGAFAREHGYLGSDPHWMQPTSTPFRDTKEDVSFQKYCKRYGDMVGIDIPGVYRLRHTTSAIKGH